MGYQAGEEFSEKGPNYLNYVQKHLSSGGENNFRGSSPLLVTGLGQSRDREARLAQLRTCRVLLLGDEIMVTHVSISFCFCGLLLTSVIWTLSLRQTHK